jgi:acyl carrier protein
VFSKDEFRRAVIDGIKRVRAVDEIAIRDDEKFADVGLDSLDGMNLVLEVEGILGIDLGEFDLRQANTIDAFYASAIAVVSKKG